MSGAKPIKVGLIGAGRIGQLHAEHLAQRVPGAKLVAIADVVRPAAEACAARWGIAAAYDDPRSILSDASIEAVVICSPPDTHVPLIKEAAQAGKHIFCEKPIDLDLKRIDRALDAVKRAGVKLQIGFNRRFDPNFRHLHEVVTSGKIGVPHLLRITSRDPTPPPIEYSKVSGGLFLDTTIHDFDMARYLIGSEVTTVYAIGGAMIDPHIGELGNIDTAIVTLQFANGVLGTIDNSLQAVYGYDQRAEVFGSEGMICAENQTPYHTYFANRQGFRTPPLLNFFIERYTKAYIIEMKEFIGCVRQNTAPPVSGQDGRIAVALGLAAQRSYQQQRPIALSEIELAFTEKEQARSMRRRP